MAEVAEIETPVQIDAQQVQPPINGDPIDKLYGVLKDKGLYSKSIDEFKSKYNTPENIDKLFSIVQQEGLYSKDKNDFTKQYFGGPIKPLPPYMPPDQRPVTDHPVGIKVPTTPIKTQPDTSGQTINNTADLVNKVNQQTADKHKAIVKDAQANLQKQLDNSDDVAREFVANDIINTRAEQNQQKGIDATGTAPLLPLNVQTQEKEQLAANVPQSDIDMLKKNAADVLLQKKADQLRIQGKTKEANNLKADLYANNSVNTATSAESQQKIINNYTALQNNKLDYKDGHLLQYEDGFQSAATGFANRTKEYDLGHALLTGSDEENIKKLNGEINSHDPNDPIPVPKGLGGTIGQFVGDQGMLLAKGAGAELLPVAGTAVAAGLTSEEMGIRSYANTMLQSYAKLKAQLRQQHPDLSEDQIDQQAYSSAKGLARDAGLLDAALGAGLALTGGAGKLGKSESLWSKEALEASKSITPVAKDALTKIAKGSVEWAGNTIKFGGMNATAAGGVQALKNVDLNAAGIKTDPGEGVGDAFMGMLGLHALFHGLATAIKGGAEYSGVLKNKLMQGFSKVPLQDINKIADGLIQDGTHTPFEAKAATLAIKDHQEVDAQIPDRVKNDNVRLDLNKKILRRAVLEDRLKTENKAFAPETKDKIAKLDEDILATSKTPEARMETPEPTAEDDPRTLLETRIIGGETSDSFKHYAKDIPGLYDYINKEIEQGNQKNVVDTFGDDLVDLAKNNYKKVTVESKEPVVEEKPLKDVEDEVPLKGKEKYFLRYTENPDLDLERGTSLHLTDFKTIKEAQEAYPDKEFVQLDNGTVGEVINGLSSYMLDADNLSDAIDEANSSIEYNKKHSGASGNNDITSTRKPILFKGRYVENDILPDGDSMRPVSIVKRFEKENGNRKTTIEANKSIQENQIKSNNIYSPKTIADEKAKGNAETEKIGTEQTGGTGINDLVSVPSVSYDDFKSHAMEYVATVKDSSFDWRLNIPELSQADREGAIKDINAGKDTKRAQKFEKAVQDMYDKGVISINRGRGNQAQSVDVPIKDWFSLEPHEQKAVDKIDDHMTSVINNEGITSENIHSLKHLFDGFPYDRSDFEAVQRYLSEQGERDIPTKKIGEGSDQPEGIEKPTGKGTAAESESTAGGRSDSEPEKIKSKDNASTIRSDQGQVSETGNAAERRQETRGNDLQSSEKSSSINGETKQQEGREISTPEDFSKELDKILGHEKKESASVAETPTQPEAKGNKTPKETPPEQPVISPEDQARIDYAYTNSYPEFLKKYPGISNDDFNADRSAKAKQIKASRSTNYNMVYDDGNWKEEIKSAYQKELEKNLEDLRDAYSGVAKRERGLKKIEEKRPSSFSDFKKRILQGTTPEDVKEAKARLADMKKQYREDKAELRSYLPKERGANFLTEKISRAIREGNLDQEAGDLAIDLLRKRPDLFEDLAISITKKPEDGKGVQGYYDSAEKLVKIFKNPSDESTAVHELLHHTERFLPQEIRDNIIQEWNKSVETKKTDIQNQLKSETDPQKRQELTTGLLYLGLAQERQIEPNGNNVRDMEAIMSKYLGGYTDKNGTRFKPLGNDWYQLYNPSEWWAVNASRLFKDAQNKPELRTWIDKTKAFYNYLVDAVKKIFKGSPTAAVEKGLKAILKGETLDQKEGAQLSTSKKLLNVFTDSESEDADRNELMGNLQKLIRRSNLPDDQMRVLLEDKGLDQEAIDKFLGATKEEDKFLRDSTKAEIIKVLTDQKKAASIGKQIADSKLVTKSKDAGKSLVNAIDPFLLDKGGLARTAAILIRENKGKETVVNSQMDQAFEENRVFWRGQSKVNKWSFILGMENPEKFGSPELRDMASIYRKRLDSVFDMISKIKDVGFLEDYFPHFWDNPKKAAVALGKRPLEGNKSFLKQRFYNDILEGMQKGLKLATDNPEEMVRLAEQNALKFKTADDIFKDLKDNKLIKYYDNPKEVPADWTAIEDPMFKRRLAFVTKDGEAALKNGAYYAPHQAATVINNYTSKGLFNSGGIIGNTSDVIRNINNIKNSFQLGIGAFHFATTTFEGTVTGAANAAQKILSGSPAKMAEGLFGLGKSLTIIPNIAEMVRTGNRVIGNLKNGVVNEDTEALMKANAKVGLQKIYSYDAYDKFRKNLTSIFKDKEFGKIPKATVNLLLTIPQKTTAPLMEWWVPRLKVGAYMQSLKTELALQPLVEGMELNKIKQKIWDDADDRLGQMVYDNIFWNKTVKDLGFMAVRSLGWTGGTIRAFYKGAKNVPESASRLVKGQGLDPRTTWALMLPVTIGALGGMYHYAMTGEAPQEMDDYFFPKDGTKNEDGTDHRVSLPSYMKDMLAYKKNFFGTLSHKLSPALQEAYEIYNNKDFYNVRIVNPDDDIFQKGLDILNYEAQSMIPFSFKPKPNESSDKQQKVEQFMGLVSAPKEFERTDLENNIMKEASKMYGDEIRTKADFDRYVARKQIRDAIRSGDDYNDVDDDLKQKANINPRYIESFKRDAKEDPYEFEFKKIPAISQIKLWGDMTGEEKEKYVKFLHQNSTFETLKNQKPELFEDGKYQEVLDDMKEYRDKVNKK